MEYYLGSEGARAGRLTRPERLLSVSEAIGARNVEQDRFLQTLEHSCQRSDAQQPDKSGDLKYKTLTPYSDANFAAQFGTTGRTLHAGRRLLGGAPCRWRVEKKLKACVHALFRITAHLAWFCGREAAGDMQLLQQDSRSAWRQRWCFFLRLTRIRTFGAVGQGDPQILFTRSQGSARKRKRI